MSGGAFKNSNNLLGRRREMEDLEAETGKLKTRLSGIEEELGSIVSERQRIVEKSAANEKIIQELILKQNTARINYDRALSDYKENEDKLSFIHLEARETEKRNDELKQALEQVGLKLSDNDGKNKSYEDTITLLNGQLGGWHKLEESISQENSAFMLEITSLESRRSFISENTGRVKQEIADIEKGIEEAVLNSSSTSQRVLGKQQEIADVQTGIENIKSCINKLSDGLVKRKEERGELSQKHKNCLAKREELASLVNELDKECFRLNNQKEQLDEKINSYTSYMWEQYELTYHSAEALKTNSSLSFNDMKKRIEELKGTIKSLGDVNINAVEQGLSHEPAYHPANRIASSYLCMPDRLAALVKSLRPYRNIR